MMKMGKKIANGYGLIDNFFPFTKILSFHDTEL